MYIEKKCLNENCLCSVFIHKRVLPTFNSFSSGNIVLPRDADAYFGVGEFAEGVDFDKGVDHGDIVYGTYLPVPPARQEIAHLDNGTKVQVSFFDPDVGTFRRELGTHWGAGIALLDRDHKIIQPLLFEAFESKWCCWIIFLYN